MSSPENRNGKGNALVSPHRVLLHPERLHRLRTWRKPRVVLTPMLGDYFHPDVPGSFLDLAFGAMLASPQHTYCVLTKRYQRAAEYLRAVLGGDQMRMLRKGGTEASNTIVSGFVVDRVLAGGPVAQFPIIVMGSAWDQPSTDAACAALSEVPGLRWGLHLEPLLAEVDLRKTCTNKVGAAMSPGGLPRWIVVGGENGPGARPMDARWALSLREQCHAAGVPFWFKGPGTKCSPSFSERVSDLEQTREVPW